MRVLICELVPNEKVASFTNVGQAANTYILNFIKACSFTKAFAFVPIQIKEKQNFENTDQVEFFQTRTFKHAGALKFLNRLVESFKMLKRLYKYRKEHIWFYNITQHYFIIYLVAKYIYRSKVYVLLADLYLNEDKFSLNKYFIRLIEKSEGVIALSKGAENLKIKQLKISNGIVSPITAPDNKSINKQDYLFAGALNKMKGIDFALEAFSKMPDKNLLISGNGTLLNMVKEYEAKFPNIKYLGWLDYPAYVKIMSDVTFCLSVRNPDDEENKYNFPSKIIEFFQYGKIVISTLPYDGIPDEMFIYTDYTNEGLRKTLSVIEAMPPEKVHEQSENVKEFVEANFSYKAINDLVTAIEI
jgi:glycosyltransferase involved in cell wall biosynthesis